jgi:hypothetical protein
MTAGLAAGYGVLRTRQRRHGCGPRANAQKRIDEAEQRQRLIATQLSEKQAVRASLIESKLKGELNQEEFRFMADMVATSIA